VVPRLSHLMQPFPLPTSYFSLLTSRFSLFPDRPPTMHPSPWTLLLIAGLFEVGWAIGLKYSHGFTRLTPSVLTVVAMAISLFLLGKALRDIPVGTGYAVWTGVGAVGTAILGIVLLNEPRDLARLGCIALIVLGIAGLKLTAPA
jgi:quaternary ammonium compound-resistance protein SugE